MEKGERETHDFMNVESFSQLPFIRPALSVKEKGGAGGGIRLFGIEFGGKESSLAANEEVESAGETSSEVEAVSKEMEGNNMSSSSVGDNNRRFECHYCCRNFPTSQALGGHQNAHKRERQHAKRAHLQSAAAMVHNGLSPEAHIYGLVNYRIGSSVSASASHHISPTSFSTSNNSTASYPTWNSHISSTSGRFYGTHHHQQPINGSPLGLWRIPPVASAAGTGGFHRERAASMHPLPLLSGEELVKSPSRGGVGASSSQGPFGYESSTKGSSVQDNVSLDLHL